MRIYDTSWSSIAKRLPGRTENSIKNFFYSSVRKLKSNNVNEVVLEKLVGGAKVAEVEAARGFERDYQQLNLLSRKVVDVMMDTDKQNEKFRNLLFRKIYQRELNRLRKQKERRESAIEGFRRVEKENYKNFKSF